MGHVAPEYAHTGDFNEKSDVYSFSILLLQLLTGHESRERVEKYIENNRFDEIIDPMIVGDGLCPEKELQLKAFADLALKCVTESAEERPTMLMLPNNSDKYVVVGTFGYLAPEYLTSNQCDEKCDVFSFGKLLLELFWGQRITDRLSSETGDEEYYLRDHVNKHIENNRFKEIVDPVIVGDGLCNNKEQQLQAFAVLAIECSSQSPINRPTMVDVAKQIRQLYLSCNS
ncbi:hypothetical protein LWI28_022291 [Acer negundo]|uniref:Protein kinase domain-containing protein n=1 Tax=Acer negundo TaxID=4023 RepID=A0AAD5JAV1_ACENE|nr:hypothetical protein LWI28_022291 [Acer negundo]